MEKRFQGIDAGSTYAKSVIIDNDGNVMEKTITESKNCKTLVSDNDKCATGYFRNIILSDKTVTEITAAIEGVRIFHPDIEVIVDIGGQDVKVIDLPTNGLTLNDKCSAGTGAFLELMSFYLGMPVGEFSSRHNYSQHEEKVHLTNTCAVFILSEVISYLAKQESIENIITGIHYSLAKRIAVMIPKEREKIAVIGGCAINKGLISAMENITGKNLLVPPEPQFINSRGAAEIIRRNLY